MATKKKKKTAARRPAKKAAKRSAAKKATKRTTKKAAKKATGKKRVPSAAFMRPVQPSAQLSAVVGSTPIPRTEVTKNLWAYIKRNGLQDSKNRRGNVLGGVRDQQALLDQFNEISAKFAEPMDDDAMTRLLEKQGNLQERIDALGLWELDHKVDMAMDALRLPPGDADVGRITGGEQRRVAL